MSFLTLRASSTTDRNRLLNMATRMSFQVRHECSDEKDEEISLLIRAPSDEKLAAFQAQAREAGISYSECPTKLIKTYCCKTNPKINPHTEIVPRTSRSWFYGTELASIYAFPAPQSGVKNIVGVVSFGGGLHGSIDSDGVLTNGDCQAYWTLCGIAPENFPKVIVKPILGASNDTSDEGSTGENTLDVETIGACCPSANTTIVLYIAPNSVANFSTVINTMLAETNKPNIISISWGLPEIYLTRTQLNNANTQFAAAVAQGISICTATGDNGANDGVGGTGNYTDFPSSSPNVIACGGTTLSCPNYVYDNATSEYAWSSGGGGISQAYAKPAYQSSLSGSFRKTPDVASVADPETGVLFIVNGQQVVYGGTSVSAPTIAGFLASIGCRQWANPLFYGSPLSNFNDILTGGNGGYYSATGYDNCTGLGSLKGNLIKNVFAGLISVESIQFLGASTINRNVGQTYQIATSFTPSNASNKKITWSSSSPEVGSVSASGLVTALTPGTTTITATTEDGGKQASLTFNVVVRVTGLTVTPTRLTIKRGQTGTLTPVIAPTNATNKTVTWSSTNNRIATVVNGVVTTNAVGNVRINATSADGNFKATATIVVTR